jgi:hypothetical protein
LAQRQVPAAEKPYKRKRVFWTDDKVAELRRLWDLGLPIINIAKIMGSTDSAIGHARHNFGLKPRDTSFPRTVWPSKQKAKPAPKPASKPLLANCKPVNLMERTGCCYIVSESGETLYCNNTIGHQARGVMWQYCEPHYKLMTEKISKHHPRQVREAGKIYNKSVQNEARIIRPYTDSDMVTA